MNCGSSVNSVKRGKEVQTRGCWQRFPLDFFRSHRGWSIDRRQVPASSTAFTLIELLVAITVVVVLAALIMPATKGVVETSRSGVCMGNLRGVGAAMLLYASDNNGRLPAVYDILADQTWNMALTENGYLPKPNPGEASILLCPSQQSKRWRSPSLTYGMRIPPQHDWYGSSYIYTVTGGTVRDLEGADYGAQSKFMIAGDSIYTGASEFEGNKQSYYFLTRSADAHAIHLRHNKRGNFLFADGHVEPLNVDSLTSDPVNPTVSTQIFISQPK
jgi:prepilin-type processing-associated H-X9-DG protein/prepilin-type N-terminal cleavage/methylation domain-containing protein